MGRFLRRLAPLEDRQVIHLVDCTYLPLLKVPGYLLPLYLERDHVLNAPSGSCQPAPASPPAANNSIPLQYRVSLYVPKEPVMHPPIKVQ